jgi:hypothetical protein
MSIDGQKAVPPEQRLFAASAAETVMAMMVSACTGLGRAKCIQHLPAAFP